jgi:hypothetical protein
MLNDPNFNPGRWAIFEREDSLERSLVTCEHDTGCGGWSGVGETPAQRNAEWSVTRADGAPLRAKSSHLYPVRSEAECQKVTCFLATYIQADLISHIYRSGGAFVLGGRPDVVLSIGPLQEDLTREYSVSCRGRETIRIIGRSLTDTGLRALCDQVDERWRN